LKKKLINERIIKYKIETEQKLKVKAFSGDETGGKDLKAKNPNEKWIVVIV
jgi:hypothetical protein